MVRSCALVNCNNSSNQNYRFFVFPSVKKVAKRNAWLKKCRHLLPANLLSSGTVINICDGHFTPDQFVNYGRNVRSVLKPSAVPTIFTRNPPKIADVVKKSLVSKMNEDDDDADSSDDTTFRLVAASSSNKTNDDSSSRLSDTDSRADEHELIEIKKDCIILSTPQGKKIVKTVPSSEVSNDITPEMVQNELEFIEEEEKGNKSTQESVYAKSTEKVSFLSSNNSNADNISALIKKNSKKLPISSSKTVDKQKNERLNAKSDVDDHSESSTEMAEGHDDPLKSAASNHFSNVHAEESATSNDADLMSMKEKLDKLTKQRDKAINKYNKVAERLEAFENNLRKFLKEDQIKLLESNTYSSNAVNWTAATLETSAKLRWIVGPRAYEYLRSIEHYPLPSFRTLYRFRNLSKINEFNEEAIQKYLELAISNEVDESEASEDELEVEKDTIVFPEHIRLEMLEPDFDESSYNLLKAQSKAQSENSEINELVSMLT